MCSTNAVWCSNQTNIPCSSFSTRTNLSSTIALLLFVIFPSIIAPPSFLVCSLQEMRVIELYNQSPLSTSILAKPQLPSTIYIYQPPQKQSGQLLLEEIAYSWSQALGNIWHSEGIHKKCHKTLQFWHCGASSKSV